MDKKSTTKQKSYQSDLLSYCDVTKVHPALRQYLGYCLHKITLLYKAKSMDIFAKYKIMGHHFSVLSVINSTDSVNQIKICDELGVDKASMVKTIDILERHKYIERVPSKDDRRVKNLVVTAQGKKVIDSVNKERKHYENAFLSSLSAQEAEQFKNTLLKLLDENT